MTIEEALEIFHKEIECEDGDCPLVNCKYCPFDTTCLERLEAVRTVYEHLKGDENK